MTDLLGAIAAVFLALDLYYVGNKNIRGPLCGLVSNLIWMYVGVQLGSISVVVTNIGIFAFNCRTLYLWTRK